MKMKFNLTKIIILMGLMALTSINHESFAYTMWDLPSGYAGYCNDNGYIGPGTICESSYAVESVSDILYNASNSCNYDDPGCLYTWKHGNISLDNIGLLSHKWAWKTYINGNTNHWYSYSYIRWFPRDNDGWTFSIYSSYLNQWLDFVVPSRAGLQYTMQDGYNAIFDKVYFWHDSIVFMDSSNSRTLQLIGHNALEDYVLYSDPYENIQNLWLLNFKIGQAWSMSIANKSMLSQYMMGKENLTVGKIVNFGWSQKYKIMDGGSLFWPSTAGNQGKDDSYIGDTYTYQYDFVFSKPLIDAGSDTEVNNPGASFGNWTNCQDKWLTIKNIANKQFMCYSDIDKGVITLQEYIDLLDYVLGYGSGSILYDTGLTFSTTGENCINYYDEAVNLYYSDLNETDYLYYMQTADSNSYEKNLIDPSNYCGTSVSITDTGNTPSGVVNTLKELLGFSSSDGSGGNTYINEIKNEFYNNISSAFTGKFSAEFIDVYKNAYNSGFNYLSGHGFNPSCSSIQSYNSSWGDPIVIGVAIRIIFLLFTLFI